MYKTICLEHVQNVHCGQKKLYRKLRSKWYGVKKKIIEEFVNHCTTQNYVQIHLSSKAYSCEKISFESTGNFNV
ncbi:hypothetical protein RirG_059270 [Rhizophagus irregularis DAOM 197198w]|uniref:Integrase zinc-binding domain-containing protein n=1 Tax=Rhizophagus irregularis (strain DAOM 197198w) TaxID=1432141 RepID=A0A015K1M7_RHIIW|nr:hypothetical protein RirG_059270 [Rhizophagus irregularis DAOM 197198w]